MYLYTISIIMKCMIAFFLLHTSLKITDSANNLVKQGILAINWIKESNQ